MPAKRQKYTDVPATPVKSFFVEMLTRDISLSDAILDLLDNCVDGILRVHGGPVDRMRPYRGFWAKISFDDKSFTIEDNCGGIPWSLHEYAFRMGRITPKAEDSTSRLGTYGIGMKRAIFKIGRSCLISTQTNGDAYEVVITPSWLEDEKDWKIPVHPAKDKGNVKGTVIYIGDLQGGVKSLFGPDRKSFEETFLSDLSKQYGFIIKKGFAITVNGQKVRPTLTQWYFAESGRRPPIRPYVYKTEHEGVKAFMVVGFTRPIPSAEEVQDEQREARYSSVDAGWTVVCNDRAVVQNDRTELTGWGEAGVPKYHTQFIAISGVLELLSDDPSKLPTTTTKRGIDASSALYLKLKNKMREGMRLFTTYTNKWKGPDLVRESRAQMAKMQPVSFGEVKQLVREEVRLKPVRVGLGGEQYKPKLPMPPAKSRQTARIAYSKDKGEVELVREYLFGRSRATPSAVGEKCFDVVHKEASK